VHVPFDDGQTVVKGHFSHGLFEEFVLEPGGLVIEFDVMRAFQFGCQYIKLDKSVLLGRE